MRISELAALAGVTVRTVRHYHAIGLLPEPDRIGSWRNYGADDLLQLVRIRACAEAGVPLADISELLASEDCKIPQTQGAPSVISNPKMLDLVLSQLDQKISQLERQRKLLRSLQDAAETGGMLPADIAVYYDKVDAWEEVSGSPEIQQIMQKTRDMVEILLQSGVFDPALLDRVEFDDYAWQDLQQLMPKFKKIMQPDWSEAEVRSLADEVVAAKLKVVPPEQWGTFLESVQNLEENYRHLGEVSNLPPGVNALVDQSFKSFYRQVKRQDNPNKSENPQAKQPAESESAGQSDNAKNTIPHTN